MSTLDKIKRTQIFELCTGIVLLALAVFGIVCNITGVLVPKNGGIFAGLISGAVAAFASCFNRKRMLRDKDKAEQILSKTYSEQTLKIQLYTARTTLSAGCYLALVVAFVFAYIDITVLLTLMWTIIAVFVLYLLCYMYYKRKF